MMILTMSLFLIFWTPILGLTNYLNDIFLEDKFQTFLKYTNGMFGFNINFNTEFFMAIQEHAAIIGYLVMLTPVLAYGLAKGSDMAISSMVSGFTSALSSGARAGALESTKQAQSTKSDIAIGEEVYSKQAGIREILGTNWANGMATQQQTKLDEFGNPINSKVNVGYGGSFELNKDESGNIHYTNAQSGQISMSSISSHTTQQVKSASDKLTGAIGELTKEEMSSVINKGIEAGTINEKTITDNTKIAAINSLIESGEWSKQDADKIAMNAGAGINGKIEKTIPGALKFISPVDVSLSAGAEAGVKFDSNTTDTLTEKLGDNKTKALENALNRQLAEKALSSDKVSSSFTNGQSSGTSASLVKAAEAGKAYSDALQVSNSINNNDLSGAIRQRAEQLAMEDGLRLNISGEMELHQKYGSKAFSQMIQESQQHELSNSHINTSPMNIYNKNNNVNPDELFAQGQNKVKGNDNINQQKLESERDNKLDRKIDKHEQGKEGVEKHLSKANSNTGVYNYENIPLVGDLVKKAFPDKNSLNGKDFINDIFSRQ